MSTKKIRGQDAHGSGEWQASRGSRKHNGVDYVCEEGEYIRSDVEGKVTKIGYPYNPTDTKKGHLRYVEVTDNKRSRVRYFYIDPKVSKGDTISPSDVLGVSQDLTCIWPGMTQHYHLEVIAYVNPKEYLPL